MAEILRLGVPIGVATLSEVGVFLGATLFVATLSVTDAAAHVLAIRVSGVTFAVSIGLLQAATVLMARTQSNLVRRRSIARAALALSLAAGLALAGGVALAAGPLAQTLTQGSAGADAASIAALLLLLAAAAELLGPAGATATGLLRGMRITRLPMAISLFGNWAVAAPLGIFLATSAGLGAVGVWVGLAMGSATASALTLIHLGRNIRTQLA
jgi:MATE family multidrug resistance protein